MKKIFLLSLLMCISLSLMSSNGNNFSYYKNLGIKIITYPFRQFLHSTRTTKIAIGAVGALLIAVYASSSLSIKIIHNELDTIKKMIDSLENNLKNKGKPAPTLRSFTVDPNDLITRIRNKIDNFETLYSLSSDLGTTILRQKEKNSFIELKNRFDTLSKKASPSSK